jgi:hypothetical protein
MEEVGRMLKVQWRKGEGQGANLSAEKSVNTGKAVKTKSGQVISPF